MTFGEDGEIRPTWPETDPAYFPKRLTRVALVDAIGGALLPAAAVAQKRSRWWRPSLCRDDLNYVHA